MNFLIKILLTCNEIKNVKKLLHTPKEKIHVELFLPTTSRHQELISQHKELKNKNKTLNGTSLFHVPNLFPSRKKEIDKH